VGLDRGCFERRRQKGFGEEESSIGGKNVTTAARGARRSLRLTRLRKRVRRGDRRELSGVGALVGVTELVRAESDLPTVLALIARTVSEVLGFGTVVLNLYRREWDDFCVTTVHGDKEAQRALLGSTYRWDDWTHLLDERFLRSGAFFIKHGEFDWRNDAGDRYVPEREPSGDPEAWHPDDEVFVPLYGPGDELLGILSIGEPASGLRPGDADLGLLVGLAHYAAQALAAAQTAIVRERHRAALEELMHVTSGLAQTLSTGSILQAVCTGISNALGFQKVCVDLLAEDGLTLVTRAAAGWADGDQLLTENLSLGQIATLFDSEYEIAGCFLVPNDVARGRIASSQVIYESELNGRGPHAWNHHWLVIPLHGPQEEIIGVIWADEPDDRLLPSEERLQALRIFANQAASALTLATQFEQMRYLANHDPLTQLPNRRAFMRELERCFAEAHAAYAPVSLIVLDLDGLKTLNDLHGHATGDDCLIQMGRLLRTELRPRDQAFRIGGDEFAVLLPGSTGPAAEQVSGRLADWLERNGRSSKLRIEASFGIATTSATEDTPDGLLRAADEAMYRMKNERKLARAVAR
jgi:diguanylate cyclase (GGDEF)-like protein